MARHWPPLCFVMAIVFFFIAIFPDWRLAVAAA